ncbi:MAG: hypothetical protein KDE56_20380 [Anaerolineales bacterium]|nr:hypothetical protein [Anaerolineales bacterium]
MVLAKEVPSVVAKKTAVSDFLFQAALLAGLGRQARLVAQQAANGRFCPHADRSCIDAGSTLLLAMAAPGERELRLVQRLADGTDGEQRWLHTQFGKEGRRRQVTAVYLHNPATAWQAAHTLSQTYATEAAFRRAHAVLGPRGRIFKCQQPLPETSEVSKTSEVSVTWQLDRQTTPAESLTTYGLPQAWTAVSAALTPLFGQSISPRSRPWSISVALPEPDRVRVGTTAWARQPEEPGKHQRLAQTIEQLGGNGRFAEALYKLALTTQPTSLTTRIGRAVEVELWRGEVAGIEMYCCVGS